MINPVLAVRGQIGGVLATGAGGAALPWWNPDGATPGGACGIWAYQPKGAASFAASLLDLSGNGNNAIDAGGAATPGWDTVNGWIFVPNNYLTTTFVAETDQSQTTLIQFTNLTNTGVISGAFNGATQTYALRPSFGGQARYQNGGLLQVGAAYTFGNAAISGNTGYRNGIAEVGAIPAWGGVAGDNMDIGAVVATGSHAAVYIQAWVTYSIVLTAAQVLARCTAMAAL